MDPVKRHDKLPVALAAENLHEKVADIIFDRYSGQERILELVGKLTGG